MQLNKYIIDEAFNFYNINNIYKDKCYKSIEQISKNEKHIKALEKIHEILYNKEFVKLKGLWIIKDVNQLFCESIDPFVTNLMIILGYEIHKNNIKKYNLDDKQISIHKKRVKECFESDLIYRGYDSIRISQMLWAVYFIRMRIIEIGSLQFEYENDTTIKIHIPRCTDFNIKNVKKSIKESKSELEKIFNLNNYKYKCNSWLLSNQLYEKISEDTNISRFHDLFEVTDGEDCINDILNFVYHIDNCSSYSNLEEKTSLQKIIKKELLNEKTFYLGNGTLK